MLREYLSYSYRECHTSRQLYDLHRPPFSTLAIASHLNPTILTILSHTRFHLRPPPVLLLAGALPGCFGFGSNVGVHVGDVVGDRFAVGETVGEFVGLCMGEGGTVGVVLGIAHLFVECVVPFLILCKKEVTLDIKNVCVTSLSS